MKVQIWYSKLSSSSPRKGALRLSDTQTDVTGPKVEDSESPRLLCVQRFGEERLGTQCIKGLFRTW